MAWSPYLPWVEYLFKDERMVDASVIHLKLSASLMVHPTFHISYVKPVAESELSPMVDYWNIDGIPAYTVQQILDVCRRGRGWQDLVE